MSARSLVFCGFLAIRPALAHPALDEQIALLTARIAQEPTHAALYLQRGEVHREHRDWALAEADYRDARRLDPGMAAVDLAQALMLLDSERPAEAKIPLDRFLAADPDHADALAARARALVGLGRPLEAAADFTHALAAGPTHRARVDFYLERSRALLSAGPAHRVEALAGLEAGVAELREPITLQLAALEIELDLARHDAALERLGRIAARSPRKETWLLRRGEILERAGRSADALAAYRAALEAIDSLPASRRATRAVALLEQQAQAALARLKPPDPPAGG